MFVHPLLKSALFAVPMTLSACMATTVRPTLRSAGESESPSGSSELLAPAYRAVAAVPTSSTSSTLSLVSKDDAGSSSLLETLRSNGALTEKQYKSLSAMETGSNSSDAQVSVGPRGFWVKSADGQSSIKIGGRVQTDVSRHTNLSGVPDQAVTDGTELRRARLEMKGTLPGDLIWAAEADFADNKTSLKDFWVGHKAADGPAVYFGNQKQPFSLDVEMSSNDIPFVERGADVYLLTPFIDRAIGVRVQDNTDSAFYAVGVYGQSVAPVSQSTSTDDEGWGVTGRAVLAPILREDEVLHVGVRGSYREPQVALGTRIRDETTNMSNFRVVDTGLIQNVNSVFLFGPEFVYARGPWSVGGEYTALHLTRNGEDFDFSGWHAQATYSLTGESRAKAYRLSAGEFKRLSADSGQAWEIAARIANLDLNNGSLSGGSENVSSLGLNCYYSKNLRFMLNWSHVLDTAGGSANTAFADGLDFFTFRAQLNF